MQRSGAQPKDKETLLATEQNVKKLEKDIKWYELKILFANIPAPLQANDLNLVSNSIASKFPEYTLDKISAAIKTCDLTKNINELLDCMKSKLV